jgi:hypothetical protein
MSERVSYWKAILETRLLPAGSSFGRSTYLCGGGGGEPARAHTLRSSVVASDRARWPMPTTQQAHAMSRTLRVTSRKCLSRRGVGTSLLTARFEFVLVVCNARFC